VFTHFDQLAHKYGCEKIRTIGDNYMVASGVPTPRDDHAHALASMALEMLEYAKKGPLSFRLGINSGPAIAGVIGTSKFQYDVWGDTVNIASRMESHGEHCRWCRSSDAGYGKQNAVHQRGNRDSRHGAYGYSAAGDRRFQPVREDFVPAILISLGVAFLSTCVLVLTLFDIAQFERSEELDPKSQRSMNRRRRHRKDAALEVDSDIDPSEDD